MTARARRVYYWPMISAAARAVAVPAVVIDAIVDHESAYLAAAYRYEPGFWDRYLADREEWRGALPERVAASYGLMQVMYTTARDHGYRDEPEGLFRPAVNLEVGCRVFAGLLAWAAGDVARALAAYNGGRGNWRGDQPQAYARAVGVKMAARMVGSSGDA